MTFSFVLNALSVVLLAVVLYRLHEIELKLQTEEQEEYPKMSIYGQTFKPIAQPSPVPKKIEQDDDRSSESEEEEEEEEETTVEVETTNRQ
jgi:hypothetical protein